MGATGIAEVGFASADRVLRRPRSTAPVCTPAATANHDGSDAPRRRTIRRYTAWRNRNATTATPDASSTGQTSPDTALAIALVDYLKVKGSWKVAGRRVTARHAVGG